LRAASDPRDRLSLLRDLVYPASPPLPSSVVAAIREFGLEGDLDRKVQDLPYARRRLLAIAPAIAPQPSVLLLDEPAAGLGAAGYGTEPVIHDVDISVGRGEVVALLGANGAGKTTTLLTLAGELPPLRGEVAFDGVVTKAPLYKRARNGLTFVTEEKSVFMG